MATAGANTTLYTVPALRTARFSLVAMVCTVGAGANAFLRLNSLTGSNIAIVFVAASTSNELLRELVLDPGDFLAIACPAAHTVTVAGFGSLLDGAPA